MVLKEDQLKVKAIVQDTIRLLVKSGLAYQLDVGIEGVIGITVDRDQVFLISLNETIQSDKVSPLGKPCGEEDKPSHGDASSAKSFSPGLSRKRRHPQQRHQQGDAGSEVSSFTPSPSYSQQDLADPDHGGGDPTTPASYRDGVNNSSSRKRRRFNAPPDDPTTLKREDSTSCFSEEDCAIVIKEEPKAELDAEDLGLDIAHEVPLAEANSVLEDLSTQFEGDPAHVADARDHHQAYYSWQQSVLLPPGSQNGGAPSGHVSGISAENHLLADQSQAPRPAVAGMRAAVEGMRGVACRRGPTTVGGSYTCSVCSRQFVSSTGLRRHEDAHRGVFHYHCPHCGKGFMSSTNLKGHIIVKHGAHSDFHCHVCRKEFAYKQQLLHHMVKRHPGERPSIKTHPGERPLESGHHPAEGRVTSRGGAGFVAGIHAGACPEPEGGLTEERPQRAGGEEPRANSRSQHSAMGQQYENVSQNARMGQHSAMGRHATMGQRCDNDNPNATMGQHSTMGLRSDNVNATLGQQSDNASQHSTLGQRSNNTSQHSIMGQHSDNASQHFTTSDN